MNTRSRNIFGFIGFGLIGGSIARSIRLQKPEAQIIAYTYHPDTPNPQLELAISDGVLTRMTGSLEDFADCDVIFLCAPVRQNISYLERLKPLIRPGCILTDVGSVKGDIHEAVADLGMNSCFIGGHPMTGTEKIGYQYSDEKLLHDHFYILTPTSEVPQEYVAWMHEFVEATGAKCVEVDVKVHDQATASISHGPHVISAALVNAVADLDQYGIYRLLAAGGFKDITRISSSSPAMWENICLNNSDCILDFLEDFQNVLQRVMEAIRQGDQEALHTFFAGAKAYRDQLINKPAGTHKF